MAICSGASSENSRDCAAAGPAKAAAKAPASPPSHVQSRCAMEPPPPTAELTAARDYVTAKLRAPNTGMRDARSAINGGGGPYRPYAQDHDHPARREARRHARTRRQHQGLPHQPRADRPRLDPVGGAGPLLRPDRRAPGRRPRSRRPARSSPPPRPDEPELAPSTPSSRWPRSSAWRSATPAPTEEGQQIVDRPARRGLAVLIAWHHSHIPQIARLIGGEALGCPAEWPDDRFDVGLGARRARRSRRTVALLHQSLFAYDRPEAI